MLKVLLKISWLQWSATRLVKVFLCLSWPAATGSALPKSAEVLLIKPPFELPFTSYLQWISPFMLSPTCWFAHGLYGDIEALCASLLH